MRRWRPPATGSTSAGSTACGLSAGGFTNLGRDHLDYHPTVEDYHRAKLRLFDTLLPKGAPAVIFADDPWSEPTDRGGAARPGSKVLTVGRKGDVPDAEAASSTSATASAPRSRPTARIHEIDLPLAGDFQISNALVAAGLAIVDRHAGRTRRCEALEKLKGAPGRLDLVGTTANGAPVYVDYAHKPDALENVLAVGAALHDRPRHRRVRLRRRPRPRQAADHGRDRDAACRRRHRHRRQSALGSAGRRSAPRSWPPRPAPSRSATGARRSATAVAMLQRRRHADRRRQGPRGRPDDRRRRPCRSPTTRKCARRFGGARRMTLALD